MTNNSSTGGYLLTENSPLPAPLEGQALLDFFQAYFSGITTIPGDLIFPRWQPNPPVMPTVSVDWMAFGITERTGENIADSFHVSNNAYNPPEFDVVIRNENITFLVSIYGPNAEANASILREGISVAQNREILQENGIGFVSFSAIQPVPALVNNIWYYRTDMSITFRRHIVRAYAILDLLSAQGTLQTDIPPITRTFTITNS